MKNKNKYFRTTNFYQASFLVAKGLELVDIEKTTGSSRAHFVFADSARRGLLLETFSYGRKDAPEVMVDVRSFITAIKSLKENLYIDKT